MILKFYTNRNPDVNLSYTPLLFPFFGHVPKQSIPYQSLALEKHGFDKSYYELTDNIEEADFVLLPYNYWYVNKKYPELVKKYCEDAEKHNKPLLIDAQGDFSESINLKNTCVLRTSQYKSRLKENEIIMPAYAEDLLERHFGGRLQVREKNKLPVVGFVGWAELSFRLKIKTFLKEIFVRTVFKKGVFFRKKVLNTLKKSSLVKTNFIIRDFHFGHIKTTKGDMSKLRQEFIDNMANSDYILCTKGDGNFSIRFYDALSLGRIPLFIDTETVLPLEDILNYKDFCVFVDYRDLAHVDKILAEFHKNISDEQFALMQRKARDAFENYLRIDKFTKYLIDRLEDIRKNFYKSEF